MRLSLCTSARNPLANPVKSAPPISTPWHQSVAEGYRAEAREDTVHALPDRLPAIDTSEIRTGEGKAYVFVAVDRTSKFVHAQVYRQMTRQIAADFLEDTLQALPYRAHTVLTDNGVRFAKKAGTEAYKPHIFDVVCYRHGIEHQLTKPFHPWTNGHRVLASIVTRIRLLP